MNILYLVPHVPNPTKARSWFHLRGLLDAGHSITVATVIRNAGDQKYVETLQAMGISVLAAPLSRTRALRNIVEGWGGGLPLQALYAWTPELMGAIETHLAATPPDVIHIEHLRMASYGLRLVKQWPVVWDAVDNLASLFEQTAVRNPNPLWRQVARLEARRLATYERWLTSKFPLTLVITKETLKLFTRGNPHVNRVKIAPLGMPITPLQERERDKDTLIMTGTFNYHPNTASVNYLIREILPHIVERKPDVRLQLVGSNPPASIQKLNSPGLEVTGYVSSVLEYLERATIALAPITYGSGIKLKVLEAFMTATPLVATSLALDGFAVQNREQVMIADTPEQFANATLELLENPALRDAIGAAGRRYVEEHHDLCKTTQTLAAFYENVCRGMSAPPPKK